MWIVLDPEPDMAIARFDDSIDAVNWIADEMMLAKDQDRIDLLRRCVIAPYDPMRDFVAG
jgi:hypothetical protein